MTKRDKPGQAGTRQFVPLSFSAAVGRDERDTPLRGGVSRLSRTHPPQLADSLRDIANRVRCLSQHLRDPERYHIEKNEIEHDLRTLARRTTTL